MIGVLGILVRPFAASHIRKNSTAQDATPTNKGGFTNTFCIHRHPSSFSIIDDVMMLHKISGKIPLNEYPKNFLKSHFSILSGEEIKEIAVKYEIDVDTLHNIFR